MVWVFIVDKDRARTGNFSGLKAHFKSHRLARIKIPVPAVPPFDPYRPFRLNRFLVLCGWFNKRKLPDHRSHEAPEGAPRCKRCLVLFAKLRLKGKI